jgi:type I restriction enzyme, S subunit
MARTRLYPPSVDPGFPALPPTPHGWFHTTFADVLEVVERPTVLNPEATYRLLTAKRNRGGIVLRSELLGREILTKTQFEARRGDFLISRRQIIHGACGVVPAELDGAIVSNEYSTLRPRPTLLLDYLKYYSHIPYFQRTCFHSSHGVDVEKMIFKLDEWLTRDVDVPPLGEQQKIAAILCSVDEAIQATQEVIDRLQVVKKAVMTELLSRGLPGRHTRFKQTEIGEVPEDWQVARLAEVADVAYGLTVNAQRRASAVTRPYLTVANVQDEGFDLSTVKQIGVLPGDPARYELQVHDLLVVEGNANPDRLGRAFVWQGEVPGILHQNHLIRVRSSVGVASPRWLAISINGAMGRRHILDHAKTSSGLHTINSKVVSALPIPLPSPEEQEAVVGVYSSAEARLDSERAFAAELKRTKEALVAVLLAGELRVKPDEDAA